MVDNVLLQCVGTSIGQTAVASLDDRLVDLEFDSLRFIQLVVQLEHALGIEFADEKLDYRRFERVRDVLQYLEELGAGTPG
jgi:acyl carrier protein